MDQIKFDTYTDFIRDFRDKYLNPCLQVWVTFKEKC